MKTKTFLLSLLAASLVLSGYVPSSMGEQTPATSHPALADANGTTYVANVNLTTVEWLGTKPGGSHTGTFPLQKGHLVVKGQTIVGGEMIMDMNALTNKDIEDPKTNQMLVNHLKSVDFFAVDSFPTSKFEITKVTPLAIKTVMEGITVTHTVEGNLTLRGITRSISFPSEIIFGRGKITARSPKFIINRTLWKANYGSRSIFATLKDKFIYDEVSLNISLLAEVK